MIKKLLFLTSFLSSAMIATSPASALTNGPVPVTINAQAYKLYYTNVVYDDITSITGAPSASTAYPVGSLTGLGANANFYIPWWGNPTAAAAAAQAWYAYNGTFNDGVKFPNTSFQINETTIVTAATPLFVYDSGDGGAKANFAAVDSTGTAISGYTLAQTQTLNYGLAAISQ